MIFWLDSSPVNPPLNWSEFQTSLKRDETNNSVLLFVDGSFVFDSDGYDYLISKVNDSFCGKVLVEIFDTTSEGVPTQAYKGYSFVSDWMIDEEKKQITIKIQDNSFYAKINNNKSLKPYLRSTQTKNGETIIKCANYYGQPSDPDTGTTYAFDIWGVRVFEAFRFLIGYMSDNSVGFASSLFDTGGTWEGLMITTGRKIREYNALNPDDPQLTPFSFSDLLSEINNRIPIMLIVEDPLNNPVIRIESASYFYKGNATVEFAEIDAIKTRFNQDKLYSKIVYGQGALNTSVTGSFPETIMFRGWNSEEFPIQYECNIDKELNIETNWITSSNVIQDIRDTLNDTYDDNLFLLQTDRYVSLAGTTTQSNILGEIPTKYYFNPDLTNSAISDRMLGGVPSSIVSLLGDVGDGTFKAYLDADQSYASSGNDVFNPAGFPNEIFDVSGDYNNTTFKFTASSGGVFSFEANVRIDITAQSSLPIVYWQIQLDRYDSLGAFVQSYDIFEPNRCNSDTGQCYFSRSNIGQFDLGGRTSVTLNLGDTIQVHISKSVFVTGDIDYTIKANNTYFGCYQNTIGGGLFKEYNPDDYQIFIHEFTYPLSKSDWEYIQQNPLNSYKFYSDPTNIRYGWISEIKRNQQSGMATVKLISDKNSQANGGAK